MATINKDFKIKSGLIVEGTTGTINGYDILTKKTADQNYIIGLIGGAATPNNTPDTVVLRDENGDFAAGTITADLVGDVTGTISSLSNHDTNDLAEGSTNKYFTDQRAVDANAGLWDTVGSATNAYNDAVATAQDYTDAEVADEVTNRNDAISTALTTAENYADTAAGNALTSANGYTDDAVGQEVTDRNSAISTAKQEAIDAAASDATSKADAAEQNAKNYADDLIADEVTRSNTYADTAASTAESNANAYTDNAVSGLAWKSAVNLKADFNIAVADSVAGLVIDGHGALTNAEAGYRLLLTDQNTASQNGIWEVFVDGGLYIRRAPDADANDELIGAAVYVQEGTQYGSTSWVQSNHYITGFAGQNWTQFSGQGSVTAGSGITVDGLEVSVNRTEVDTWYDAAGDAAAAESAANSYTDDREIVITGAYQSYADTVGDNANDYTNQEISTEVTNRNNAIDSAISTEVTNRNNAIATAKSEAIGDANAYTDGLITDEITDRNNAIDNAINALDTDDIEEGSTNQYFTDSRAKDSAADLLTGASLTNITITGSGAGLTITAENGVADSDTDDLAEGSTNLYFTNERAVDALYGSNIQPESIDITWVRRENATWTNVPTASQVVCHQAGGGEGSMKYLVRVTANVSGTQHSHVTELLATVDGSNNVAVVEYGTIYTSAEPMATATVLWNGLTNCYELNVTTANNNSEVMVAATMLAYQD